MFYYMQMRNWFLIFALIATMVALHHHHQNQDSLARTGRSMALISFPSLNR